MNPARIIPTVTVLGGCDPQLVARLMDAVRATSRDDDLRITVTIAANADPPMVVIVLLDGDGMTVEATGPTVEAAVEHCIGRLRAHVADQRLATRSRGG